jgi:hypothetical protein
MAAPEIRKIVRLLQSEISGYYFFALTSKMIFLSPRLPLPRRRGFLLEYPVADDS